MLSSACQSRCLVPTSWDWGNLLHAWDWAGIATHLSIEEISGAVVFSILWWGRRHARHHGFLHRFAHNFKAQFAVDMVIDIIIAVTTIQVMHL